MVRRARNAVSVIEAAYAVDEPEEGWLAGLVDAAEPDLGEGLGVCAYSYDARRTPLRIGALTSRGAKHLPANVRMAVEMSSMDQDYVARTWRTQSFATVSETVDMQTLEAARGFVESGVNDILVVNAYDPSGVGVWLGAPLARARRPTSAEGRVWNRVSSHIAVALRLRLRIDRVEAPAAVLSPSGRVEHAEGPAEARQAREALRDAVLRMERARGPLRKRDPDAAVDTWRAMVDARWSLLDRFERGGKRYVVAVQNESALRAPDSLTPREAQIVAAAAAGRTNKLIAYELGLSDSTVRVLLARAARKLDVSSRRELVRCYLAHERARSTVQG